MVINPDTWVETDTGDILIVTKHPDLATRQVQVYDMEDQSYRPIPVDSIVHLFK